MKLRKTGYVFLIFLFIATALSQPPLRGEDSKTKNEANPDSELSGGPPLPQDNTGSEEYDSKNESDDSPIPKEKVGEKSNKSKGMDEKDLDKDKILERGPEIILNEFKGILGGLF